MATTLTQVNGKLEKEKFVKFWSKNNKRKDKIWHKTGFMCKKRIQILIEVRKEVLNNIRGGNKSQPDTVILKRKKNHHRKKGENCWLQVPTGLKKKGVFITRIA